MPSKSERDEPRDETLAAAPSRTSPSTGPIPAMPAPAAGHRQVFWMLKLRNGRLFIGAQFLYSVGWWMSRVGIDWLVLQLTGDLALVGLAVTLQLVPSLAFSAWAGVLADRYTRRNVLMVAQAAYSGSLALLAVLALLGAVESWHVFAVCALSGLAIALDGPARLALLPEVVGLPALRHALSLNSMTISLGGLSAPVVGGVVIALVGTGWALAISAIVSFLVVGALSFMRQRELITAPTVPRVPGQLREAVRYCLSRPAILWPLLLVTVVCMFGFSLSVLFAGAATEAGFDTGSGGYGLYMSVVAVGAMAGAFVIAGRRSLRLRSVVLASGFVGVATIGAGLAGWEPLFFVALIAIGASRSMLLIGAETMTQLATDSSIRGRVMSFYFLLAVVGQSIGSLLLGWLAQIFGLTPTFLFAGAATIIVAIIAAASLARRHRLGLRFRLRPGPGLTIVSRASQLP
jgi:MFS family permease